MITFNEFATAYVIFGLIRAVKVLGLVMREEVHHDHAIPLWLAVPIIFTIGAFWGFPLFVLGALEKIGGRR